MALITLEEMEELINKTLADAGIDLEKDHEATLERHKEIMELIDKTAQEMQEASVHPYSRPKGEKFHFSINSHDYQEIKIKICKMEHHIPSYTYSRVIHVH